MVEHGNELKKLLKADKLVLGNKVTLKKLRQSETPLSQIYIARNCPAEMKDEVEHYAELAGVPVEETNLSNEEIGVLCKKAYFVSVVGVLQ